MIVDHMMIFITAVLYLMSLFVVFSLHRSSWKRRMSKRAKEQRYNKLLNRLIFVTVLTAVVLIIEVLYF